MRRRSRQRAIIALATVAAMGSVAAVGFLAGPSALATIGENGGDIRSAGGPTAIKDSYLVVLNDGPAFSTRATASKAVNDSAWALTRRHGGTARRQYSNALHGFEGQLSEREARQMATDPAVKFVAQNHIIRATDTQLDPPSIGLDRIDQRDLPFDRSYAYPNTASDVTVYIIDTGIRLTNEDFGGRAVFGFNAADDSSTEDCGGHGTHTASIAGGSKYGVAKSVKLVALRVFNCAGIGTVDNIVAAIDFVSRTATGPSVVNISLSTDQPNEAIDTTVANSVAAGITYTVAASNENTDACTKSPAREPSAITVGATGNDDTRAGYSNFGSCVDIFAPGNDITSAGNESDNAVGTASGTSEAAPHAAGVAAMILQANPQATPEQVRRQMTDIAIAGAVKNPGSASPNLLLQVPGPVRVRRPAPQITAVGNATSLQLQATTTLPGAQLTYSATDLPPGLTLDPATGRITGKPTTVGNYTVHVTAKASKTDLATTTFTWKITTHTGNITDSRGRCIDVKSSQTDNGTVVQTWECGDTLRASQGWTVDGLQFSAMGNCMSTENNNGTADGTGVVLWDCDGGPAQQWRIDSKTGAIRNVGADKCVTAAGDWDPITIRACTGAANQRWALPRTQQPG